MATRHRVEMTSRQRNALARAIADVLFRNGQGEVADRLVLTIDAFPDRQLGGWCKAAVIDRICDVVDGEEHG